MAATRSAPKRIGEVFYQTRVLMGRDFTLRRFAQEALAGSIDPVMLGYIEKGKRFPSDALVRRLANVRKEDPHQLLAILWRDRILYAFGRELKRVLHAPHAVEGVDDAELAIRISHAIAALPDDGDWITLGEWRKRFRSERDRRSKRPPITDAMAKQVEETLRQRQLIEIKGRRVHRLGHHYVAQGPQERQALATEFCLLFIKALLDKLALPEVDTGTYLRNHYLNIDPARLPEFHQRLEQAARQLVEEFAVDPSSDTRFLNVLLTATPM